MDAHDGNTSKTDIINTTAHQQQDVTSNSWNKAKKLRYKKLRRKANEISSNQEVSGILLLSERKELEELALLNKKRQQLNDNATANNNDNNNENSIIGPCCLRIRKRSIHKRTKKHKTNNSPDTTTTTTISKEFVSQNTEGTDHRSLLFKIFQQIHSNCYNIDGNTQSDGEEKDNKKRKREYEEVDKNNVITHTIPSWAAIHNPSFLQSLAILEIHLPENDEKKEDWEILQQKLPILSEIQQKINKGENNNDVLAVKTRWFQGPNPQSITDTLMYYTPIKNNDDKKSNEKQKKNSGLSKNEVTDSTNSSLIYIYDELKKVILTPEDLEREGYPISKENKKEKDDISNQDTTDKNLEKGDESQGNVTKPIELPSLEDSRFRVKQCRVELTITNAVYRKRKKEEEKKAEASLSNNDSNCANNNNQKEKSDIYVAAPTSSKLYDSEKNAPRGRIFALDCEMVRTAKGRELARVTIVQFLGMKAAAEEGKPSLQYEIILDEFVKPYSPVLDYVTKYSGVTAALLNPVETRLEQIQAFLLKHIHPENDILVGHSLENDLHSLRFLHSQIVDTSILFRQQLNFRHGRKYALKHLTAALLHRTIQQNTGPSDSKSNEGHCSEVDAVASLELAIRRVQEGPSFRMKDDEDDKRNRRIHILQQSSEIQRRRKDQPIVFVGPSDWLRRYVPSHSSAHALSCETIHDTNHKAITAWLGGKKRKAKMVWAKFVMTASSETSKDDPATNKDKSFQILNDIISQLYHDILPQKQDTVVMVAFQTGLDSIRKKLKERRVRSKNNSRASLFWTEQDEKHLSQYLIEIARYGTIFWMGSGKYIEK